MLTTLYVGVDNGVTGWMAALDPRTGALVDLRPVPTYREVKETKAGGFETHIQPDELEQAFLDIKAKFGSLETRVKVVYERPMINPMRFVATISAVRADEVLRVILARLSLPKVRLDSKQWQAALLPTGLKGPELKKASKDVALRLFPEWRERMAKAKDGDAILIAEFARRMNL